MVWNQKKGSEFYSGTWGGLNSNLEFEFKRNSTTRVQTSNISSKLKRKDHVYELSLNMELIKTKNSTSMYELILNFKNK